jgi:hypothetical protein
MLHFYLEGNLPLEQQEWPETLDKLPEEELSEIRPTGQTSQQEVESL